MKDQRSTSRSLQASQKFLLQHLHQRKDGLHDHRVNLANQVDGPRLRSHMRQQMEHPSKSITLLTVKDCPSELRGVPPLDPSWAAPVYSQRSTSAAHLNQKPRKSCSKTDGAFIDRRVKAKPSNNAVARWTLAGKQNSFHTQEAPAAPPTPGQED